MELLPTPSPIVGTAIAPLSARPPAPSDSSSDSSDAHAARIAARVAIASPIALAAIAGLLFAPAFDDERAFALTWISLTGFFAVAAATRRRRIGLLAGFAYGTVAYGAALGWLFDAVDPGAAPLLAWLLPALLISALALVPALIGALLAGAPAGDPTLGSRRLLLLVPALWTLADLARHQTDLAFPWLALGNSQVPLSPLAGFAPVGGVLLAGYATALLAALAAAALLRPAIRLRCALGATALLAAGAGAGALPSTAASGAPLRVAVAHTAFDNTGAAALRASLAVHRELVQSATADVLLLPENTLPLPAQWLGSYLQALRAQAAGSGRDVVTGVYELAAEPQHLHVSAISVGTSGVQVYRKRRLVPFGEFVPFDAALAPVFARVRRAADRPPAALRAGDPAQPLPVLGGGRVALMLCYEDAFGDALRLDAAEAGWLAVLANDGWLPSPRMARQHARLAQARALESGRPLLRAANGGPSGAIDHRGRWQQQSAADAPALIEATVVPRSGRTPYALLGDGLALAVALLALIAAALAAFGVHGTHPTTNGGTRA
jgi:apolipoprotein N-acyltransferase